MSTPIEAAFAQLVFDEHHVSALICRSRGLSEASIAKRCAEIRNMLQLEPCWEVSYLGAAEVRFGLWEHRFVALHEVHRDA